MTRRIWHEAKKKTEMKVTEEIEGSSRWPIRRNPNNQSSLQEVSEPSATFVYHTMQFRATLPVRLYNWTFLRTPPPGSSSLYLL